MRIDELVVADTPEAWRALGFAVDDDGVCRISTVDVRLAGAEAGRGIVSWALEDDEPAGAAPVHENGVELIDHVVMTTPDPERTIADLQEQGMAHRRTRLPDNYDQPMRQDFFRLGEVILEVIGPRQPDESKRHRPDRLYGLAFTVADLDATAAHLGDRLGAAKDAVQTGRRIATLRRGHAAVPLAFMSADEETAP